MESSTGSTETKDQQATADSRNGGAKGMLAPKQTAAGYTAAITMGVHV